MSLAYCWETAKGFPKQVKKALAANSRLRDLELLLAIPEYEVNLPGGRAASQNDLFVLARSQDGLVCMMVEGKVNEPFGPQVGEWCAKPSKGKTARLDFLCRTLDIDQNKLQSIRYQLLHRTASAIIEARRFKANEGVMLVHSFSPSKAWFDDFQKFAGLFGLSVHPGEIHHAGKHANVDLFIGWVTDSGDYGEEKAPKMKIEGTVVAKVCECCGHHEVGVETENGKYLSLRPGDKIKVY